MKKLLLVLSVMSITTMAQASCIFGESVHDMENMKDLVMYKKQIITKTSSVDYKTRLHVVNGMRVNQEPSISNFKEALSYTEGFITMSSFYDTAHNNKKYRAYIYDTHDGDTWGFFVDVATDYIVAEVWQETIEQCSVFSDAHPKHSYEFNVKCENEDFKVITRINKPQEEEKNKEHFVVFADPANSISIYTLNHDPNDLGKDNPHYPTVRYDYKLANVIDNSTGGGDSVYEAYDWHPYKSAFHGWFKTVELFYDHEERSLSGYIDVPVFKERSDKDRAYYKISDRANRNGDSLYGDYSYTRLKVSLPCDFIEF